MATRQFSQALIALALFALSGCQLTKARLTGDDVAILESEIKNLESLVAATREDLQTLNSERSSQLQDVNNQLAELDGDVKRWPGLITEACQQPEIAVVACDDVTVQTLISQDEKMILGQVEDLWINPPGLHLRASIDTGAASNSIHATNITPFERDGENWVRFELSEPSDPLTNDSSSNSASTEAESNTSNVVVVEEKVVRLLRISKRPVVRLRVRLGNVLDSFDFILRDRSKENHPVELGRNFLQDIAVVDVAKQFVQPPVRSEQPTP